MKIFSVSVCVALITPEDIILGIRRYFIPLYSVYLYFDIQKDSLSTRLFWITDVFSSSLFAFKNDAHSSSFQVCCKLRCFCNPSIITKLVAPHKMEQ